MRINTDRVWAALKSENQVPGVIPRDYKKVPCGSIEIAQKPVADLASLDNLVDPKDYKEVIAYCHEHKIFPKYHQQATWASNNRRWNQNGLPYCWAWGITGTVMDCQAAEGKRDADTPLLAPVSLGFTVNWRSAGNYLESAIRGVVERGIAPDTYIPDQHSRNYRNYEDGWVEAALKNRIPADNVFDCNPSKMIQYMVTGLYTGRAGYNAFNWWGHATSICSLIWDESEMNNIIVEVKNSHDETEPIQLTGRRAIPDEMYFIGATVSV